ncbi:MAG: NADH-quinone oxidoreductase subunit C [Anaerolineae bacterium]|nr:NADH-quinone oxidoreductase subunit C [Anaerolineae bacterium]
MTDQVVDKAVKTAAEIYQELQTRFGSAVQPEDREGFEGVVVDSSKLVEVAAALRDEYGYDYLANACAVDNLGWTDNLEMVYHLDNVRRGIAGTNETLVLKARTPRDNATLPSLIGLYPGADFQEREAWDLHGIWFEGHPNMKRILMWEGFNGHPMRKDWQEAYYEEEHKPFESRWPEGHVKRSEEDNLFGHNVTYPPGFTPDGYRDISETSNYAGLGLGVEIEGDLGMKTDKLVVNLGPHHPSTHGVFRMVVQVSGETIENLEPVMGYLHRNHEKIGERNTWIMNMPFTDRLDYLSSMSNNLGYALAVEKLMAQGGYKGFSGLTRRAELIRVLVVELTRIVNHVWATGFFLNDLGAFQTPMLYLVKERELILDFFEAIAGSRMMCNYMRFGGVAGDVPDRLFSPAIHVGDRMRDMDMWDYLHGLIFDRLPRAYDEMYSYLVGNEILVARTQGVGILPPELAIAYSAAGPVLRASGVPYDLRKVDQYSIYNEFDFDVAVRYNGDCYDRMMIRFDEIRESVRILQQVLPMLKECEKMPVYGIDAYNPRMPQGESYGRVENPKGELGYYVVARGGKEYDQNPWRYHVRSPSFINLTALGEMCKGHKVADVVVILGSIDIVLGEVDR